MTDKAEYDRKLAAALAELRATSMWSANYDPPMDRALRRLGLRLRPPHYRSFMRVFLGYALFFAIGWGALMWMWAWREAWVTAGFVGVPWEYLVRSCIFGSVIGLALALSLFYDRRKHRLRDWDAL